MILLVSSNPKGRIRGNYGRDENVENISLTENDTAHFMETRKKQEPMKASWLSSLIKLRIRALEE